MNQPTSIPRLALPIRRLATPAFGLLLLLALVATTPTAIARTGSVRATPALARTLALDLDADASVDFLDVATLLGRLDADAAQADRSGFAPALIRRFIAEITGAIRPHDLIGDEPFPLPDRFFIAGAVAPAVAGSASIHAHAPERPALPISPRVIGASSASASSRSLAESLEPSRPRGPPTPLPA